MLLLISCLLYILVFVLLKFPTHWYDMIFAFPMTAFIIIFGQLYQNNDQEVELDKEQIVVFKVVGTEDIPVEMENIYGEKLDNQDGNDDALKPGFSYEFPSVQGVEQQYAVFDDIEKQTAVNNPADTVFDGQ